jgi:hypothetical protein
MQRAALVEGSEDKDVIRVEGSKQEAPIETIARQDGIKVSWHDGIEVVPGKGCTRKKKKILFNQIVDRFNKC